MTNETLKFTKKGAIFSTSKSTVLVQGEEIIYGGQSLKLNQLASVESSYYTSPAGQINSILQLLGNGGGINGIFVLTLTDQAGSKLTFPIGDWKDQDNLFAIISKYSTQSGATINDAAAKLFSQANKI